MHITLILPINHPTLLLPYKLTNEYSGKHTECYRKTETRCRCATTRLETVEHMHVYRLNGEDVPRKRVFSDLAKKIFKKKIVPKVWPRKREIHTSHKVCAETFPNNLNLHDLVFYERKCVAVH